MDRETGAIPAATGFMTAFGRAHIVWVQSAPAPQVQRIILPGDPLTDVMIADMPLIKEPPDRDVRTMIAGIQSFLKGSDVRFDIDLLDMNRCPPFRRRVLLAEYDIPRGYISTYGRVARHLEKPDAARAVGNALAKNPFPPVIPCHRVLHSDGSLGGFQAGLAMKRRLLEMEGARFREDGRVFMERVWY